MLSIDPTRSSREEIAKRRDQFLNAIPAFCGDGQDRFPGGLAEGREMTGCLRQIGLVGDDQKRPAGEAGVVLAQFFAKKAVIFGGISILGPGSIDHEKQDGTTLDMAEKIMTEALAGMGSFNESGNIGNGEALFLGRADDPDGRMEGGERIRGDLRLCRGEGGQEAGFARIWQADESNLGDGFQDEDKFPGLAGLAILGVPGSLPDRAGEAGVAPAAAASPAEHMGLPRLGQIHQWLGPGAPH